MNFSSFSQHLLKLEQTASRLEMTELLAQVFQELDPDEVVVACYLMQGTLVPLYQSLDFQMSSKMVLRALARLQSELGQGSSGGGNGEGSAEVVSLFGETDYSAEEAAVTKLYKSVGDIGLAAEQLVNEITPKQDSKDQLSVQQVFDDLVKIATLSGVGSQEQKVHGLVQLLAKVDAVSARYVSRMVVGKLRLGFSTMTMLDALSWAVVGDKSESGQLEMLYQRRADIGLLAQQYLKYKDTPTEKRFKALDDEIKVTIGIPVVPALCQRLNSAEEIIAKMGQVIVEPKYDGLRVQIHLDGTAKAGQQVHVFTRNLDNVTHMFPELQDVFSRLSTDQCILDAEAIGYHKETGELLPFQETITRRRKHDVSAKAAEVPIRFYIFDILKMNEELLLDKKLRDRKEVLKKLFSDNEVLLHTPYVTSSIPEDVHAKHTEYLAQNLEGAVIKQVDSHYISGRKGWNWVKIKEAEGMTGKLSDTLDCIVMGYYYGLGKRSDFGIGALLVGVIDEAGQQVKTVAKIGTGLSDEMLRELKKIGDANAVVEKPDNYIVNKNLNPDVWCRPQLVVEIAADELTKSPIHSAGVAMRFPRLIKIRDDKNWEQATTVHELSSITIA